MSFIFNNPQADAARVMLLPRLPPKDGETASLKSYTSEDWLPISHWGKMLKAMQTTSWLSIKYNTTAIFQFFALFPSRSSRGAIYYSNDNIIHLFSDGQIENFYLHYYDLVQCDLIPYNALMFSEEGNNAMDVPFIVNKDRGILLQDDWDKQSILVVASLEDCVYTELVEMTRVST